MYDELVKELREEAEWAEGNEWETPIMLSDHLKQAADAIEQLSNAGSAYGRGWTLGYDAGIEESKPRWIPVTEQLIHSGWYLVACNEWGGSAVRKAIYDEATRKWLEFPCGGPKNITKFVTHYMPLPEPPKEE